MNIWDQDWLQSICRVTNHAYKRCASLDIQWALRKRFLNSCENCLLVSNCTEIIPHYSAVGTEAKKNTFWLELESDWCLVLKCSAAGEDVCCSWCVFAACWPVFRGSALCPQLRAEVSRQSCGMAGMAGMPGTRGPMPDAHPRVLRRRVYACVWPVQSRAVRRSRGLDSAVQTLSPGDKDPPVLVCFTRTLISHAGSSVLALPQPAVTCSPCTCPHQDISPQFPPLIISPPPPAAAAPAPPPPPPPPLCEPGLHHRPLWASWKSPSTTGSGRSLPVHNDNHHPTAQSALICPARPTVSILKQKIRTI